MNGMEWNGYLSHQQPFAIFLLYMSNIIWKWNQCRITSKTKTDKYLEI